MFVTKSLKNEGSLKKKFTKNPKCEDSLYSVDNNANVFPQVFVTKSLKNGGSSFCRRMRELC